MIPLNSTQITQVFTNIIDNAIYAMLEIKNPQLVIEVTENASVILVTIKDNGAGIPYQIQSRIMEPFFTTKPVGKGTGLGLCVSFGIIEKHNGKLTFTSEPGKGSTFIVELPK
jgi:signal transduction histidine kinase